MKLRPSLWIICLLLCGFSHPAFCQGSSTPLLLQMNDRYYPVTSVYYDIVQSTQKPTDPPVITLSLTLPDAANPQLLNWISNTIVCADGAIVTPPDQQGKNQTLMTFKQAYVLLATENFDTEQKSFSLTLQCLEFTINNTVIQGHRHMGGGNTNRCRH